MPLEEFRREFRLPARDFYMERVTKESLPKLEGWFLEGFKLAGPCYGHADDILCLLGCLFLFF